MGKFILEDESVTDEKCYKETDVSADERQKETGVQNHLQLEEMKRGEF